MTNQEYEKEYRRLQSLYYNIASDHINLFTKGLWTLSELANDLKSLSRDFDIEIGHLLIEWRKK